MIRIQDACAFLPLRVTKLVVVAFLLLMGIPIAFGDTANNKQLRIYEVAGSGGLSGSNYRQDTIILFNPSSSTISCTTCAIQYHSASNSSSGKWTAYKLPALNIPPGGYYMIAGSAVTLSSSGTVAPISYDYQLQSIETNNSVASDQNILSSTSATIALTNTQTALKNSTSTTTCVDSSVASAVLDVVGYGSTFATNSATTASAAACYAGNGNAYYDGSTAYGRKMGVTRKNPCTDTADNAADWANTSVTYFNSASNPTVCPVGGQLKAEVSASPSNPGVGTTVTFSAKITAADNPTSSVSSVMLRYDLPYYGGQAVTMYDDGTNGDVTAGDQTYTLSTAVPSSLTPGYTYPTNITVTDANGDTYTGVVNIAATVAPPSVSLNLYEVAAGGGNANSGYSQDTIVLFNPSTKVVACSTCALQLHSASGNSSSWTVYSLPTLSIPAGGYYMIAASAPSSSASASSASAAYDYRLGTIEGILGSSDDLLSASAGVVALTSTTQALTSSSGTLCGTGTQLVDMVGYGSSTAMDSSTTATPTSCYEGKGQAYYDGSIQYGYKMGIVRKNACINTSENSTDWINTPVAYLNSASTSTPCPTGTQISETVSASPARVGAGGQVTFSSVVTAATQPASSGLQVRLNLNSPYFGGQSLTMYDDGTNGDQVAGDGTYTLATNLPAGAVAGFTYPVSVTAADANGNSYTGSTSVSVPLSLGNSGLRIVAFYGAGNLSKSMYGRDTVILFNPTQQTVAMNNWSLQTGGTTGAFSTVYKLPNVSIPAGGYYAIAGSGASYISSSGCTSSICNLNYAYDYQLKTLEGTATTTDNDLSSTATVLALVNSQTALGSGCPLTSDNLVDILGVGASDGSAAVTCFAGSNYAPYTPATTNGVATSINGIVYAYATVRKNKCGNTFDNANDFMLGYIDFENSQSTPNVCPVGTQMAVSAKSDPSTGGALDPLTLTAQLTPAIGSSGLSVTADLSNLGLSAAASLYDDGTHGDQAAGDGVYTLATAPASGTPGAITGLIVTAKDKQGNVAQNSFPFSLLAGDITLTAPATSATVTAGGVANFTITIDSLHGYNGVLGITCTGSPNANSLGIPVATQCIANPSEVTMAADGTAKLTIAIASSLTTTSSGPQRWPLGLTVALSVLPLAIAFRRRRHVVRTALAVLAGAILILGMSACGRTSVGLSNLKAQSGTYTYTVTATDSNTSSVTRSITFTVNVQ